MTSSFLLTIVLLSILRTLCKAESHQTLLMSDNTNKMFRCELKSLFYCAEINFTDTTIHAMDVFETNVFAALGVGVLWRCKTNAAHTCEVLYRVNTPITALALSKDGKHVYIGHSNKIWRCDAYLPNSCFEFHPFDSRVHVLAASSRYIFAGLENGKMWRCAVTHPKDCQIYNDLTLAIQALTVNAEYIYAGLKVGTMHRCGANKAHTCSIFNIAFGQSIMSLDVHEGYVYGGLEHGQVWKCDANKAHGCAVLTTRTSKINSLKVIPGTTTAGCDCVNGQQVPKDWNFMSLKNRTTVEYEFNITRDKH